MHIETKTGCVLQSEWQLPNREIVPIENILGEEIVLACARTFCI